jgi:hypothetical protein
MFSSCNSCLQRNSAWFGGGNMGKPHFFPAALSPYTLRTPGVLDTEWEICEDE